MYLPVVEMSPDKSYPDGTLNSDSPRFALQTNLPGVTWLASLLQHPGVFCSVHDGPEACMVRDAGPEGVI
jgi:hypothetical protein